MENLTREQARIVVEKALRLVANFTGDFEQFVFRSFRLYHKQVFLDSIKNQLNVMRLSPRRYLDIRMSQADFDGWKNVGECIDYVHKNTSVTVSSSSVQPLSREDM